MVIEIRRPSLFFLNKRKKEKEFQYGHIGSNPFGAYSYAFFQNEKSFHKKDT